MIQGEEQLEKMEEQKKEMEQNKEYFLELKQIYNTPIPKPDVNQQNLKQKFLFYIDLTNSEIYIQNSLLELSINNSIQRKWQGGFLGEIQFHNQKKEQQHIFCYYFNKLIENNGNINIQHLFRFRLFLQEFISTQKNYQIKFVFHFKQKNDNQEEFEDHIVKCVYQVLEGSFDKLNDIIGVYNIQERQQINYCKISSKKIHFNKNQQCDRFDISFITKLDQFLEYFQYKQNDPNQIGYLCQEYVQEKVNVVLKEFEKELIHLQKDIQLMLEFPVNLNNEIKVKQNVEQYLLILKATIFEINQIIIENVEFDHKSQKLKTILKNQRQKFILQLSEIAKENTQFEKYLKQIYEDKSPQEIIDQLLQFQFELLESDNEILQKLKKHKFNQDCINATLSHVRLNLDQWIKYFDQYLIQSYALMKRIIFNYKDLNYNIPWVFILGMTRVGKSTLLNILSNPDNIIINKDNKFDVKEEDQKIKVSHSNNSETFEIQSLETENFIFQDVPGLGDTDQMTRVSMLINHYKKLKQSKKAIFLLMIDGEQLQTSKNDLIDSIAKFSKIFGEQTNDINFEKLIIPVFTNLRNDSTMEQIKQKWQTDTMKNITDKTQLTILNLIKKAIDEDNYQKIHSAEFYQIQNEHNQQEQDIKQMQEKSNDGVSQRKYSDGEKCGAKMDIIKQRLDILQKTTLSSKIKEIKTNLIRKCENLLEEQKNNSQLQNIQLQLTPDKLYQLDNLQKILPNGDKFQQHILNIITHDFIAKMLFDKTITIDDKFQYICELIHREINDFKTIPSELININNIIYQMKLLDVFNIKSNIQNSNKPDKIFQQFQLQIKLLYNAFTKIVPMGSSFFYLIIIYQLSKKFNQQQIQRLQLINKT